MLHFVRGFEARLGYSDFIRPLTGAAGYMNRVSKLTCRTPIVLRLRAGHPNQQASGRQG